MYLHSLNKLSKIRLDSTVQKSYCYHCHVSVSRVCLTCLSHVSVPQDVAILITDGQANVEQDQVNRETQLIKDQGVELFVVGITNEVDQAELRRIASDPDSTHVFEVGSGSLGHSGWGVGGCLIPAL